MRLGAAPAMNGEWLAADGQTFGAWMQAGGPGAPGWSDWELHLTSVFPEVRIKPYIEIRGADSVGSKTVCALPALSKGVIYDETSLSKAEQMISGLTYADAEAARPEVAAYRAPGGPICMAQDPLGRAELGTSSPMQ